MPPGDLESNCRAVLPRPLQVSAKVIIPMNSKRRLARTVWSAAAFGPSQPVSQSDSQSVSQSISQSVCQSVNQFICLSVDQLRASKQSTDYAHE